MQPDPFRSAAGRFVVALCWWASAVVLLSAQFKFGEQTLTVPDGFEVELIAGPPLVNRPIVADFDELGRLYIADSSGSNDKVEKQLAERPHRIVRLEDNDGDGRFDRSTVFADRMMFPEGVLWFDGAVYCGAPPSIWRLRDNDGDGVAEERTEWFKGGTLTGCANDLHGPYLGPDGRIYWCKGAFAKQTHDRPGLPTISDSASHIFRARPDGSSLDSVMSGGMDNPVEVAFTRGGEAIFTTTFFVHPEAGRRDALVHAVYGGVYPKPHGVLDGLKRTGDLLPALTHLGPAVPSGLLRYESRAWGDEYQDNLFSTQFNLHQVQRHVLAASGATFRSQDIDFLVSDNPDFHPTDVLEDADGSLIVFDTGGWYKLCCPSSQIAKPNVLGAVYRVRRRNAPALSDPRGLKLEWERANARQLVDRLADARPAVRKRALAHLARRGPAAIGPLKQALAARPKKIGSDAEASKRLNAVWALTRIDGDAARAAGRNALLDADAIVRQAAVHSAALHRDAGAGVTLKRILNDDLPALQRTAAEALGRIGEATAVPVLLNLAARNEDRFLEHSLIYALIEIGDRAAVARALDDTALPPAALRAALIALDQMDQGQLAAARVIPLLTSTNRILKPTANWIAAHHPDWGGDMIEFFKARLDPVPAQNQRAEVVQQLASFARDAAVQKFIAREVASGQGPRRLLVLEAMAQSGLGEIPNLWAKTLVEVLPKVDVRTARLVVQTLRAIPQPRTNRVEIAGPLLEAARKTEWPLDLRVEALAAVPAPQAALDESQFRLVYEELTMNRPAERRSLSATVLGRSQLDDGMLDALVPELTRVSPVDLGRLLGAFERSTNEALGLKLISALRESPKTASAVSVDELRQRLRRMPAPVQHAIDEYHQAKRAATGDLDQKLIALESHAKTGDRGRGHLIFNSTRAACATCHAIGYLGGRIGPDLTRIGAVRTERDLLESILLPSATFVRSYEPAIVQTRDGEQYSGIVREESADTVLVVTGPTAEQRLARAQITEMRPGTVSVMPAGLEEQLSRTELADLVAFLKSLK